MEEKTEPVNFNEYVTEERHKRLSRDLKLAKLKKGSKEIVRDDLRPSLASPSISSINADTFDSSANTPYSKSSKHDSEVVSSSHNLRNILKKQYAKNDLRSIVTSSVKSFNNKPDPQADRFAMPPPNSDHVCVSKKLRRATMYNNTEDVTILQSECVSSDVEKDFPTKTPANFVQFDCDTVYNKKPKSFTRWKVLLNEQGHLIIKGTIDSGQIARSKPIVRRLSAGIVESSSKHLYSLQENIIDDEHELPDYIKGKFYSGFPDDWENVCQVWRTFVQQGSRVTFRWPTKIADSDDDLKSEVTDITYISDSSEDKTLNCSSFKETHASRKPFNPGCTFNVLESNKERQNYSSRRHGFSDSFTQTRRFDGNRNSLRNVAVQTPAEQYSYDKENYEQQKSISSNYSYIEKEKINLKDKLNVMIDKLTVANCSQEWMNKVAEMFDCINYVVSHGSMKDSESCIEDSQQERSQCTMQGENDKSRCSSQECSPSVSIPLLKSVEYGRNSYDTMQVHCKDSYFVKAQDMTANRITDCNNLLQKKKSFTEMNKEGNNDSSSDSENEVYAGVPKISANRILRQRRTLTKPCKRKITKHDIKEKKYSSEMSTRRSYTETIRSENVNSLNCYDSSVSIIENETEGRRVKTFNTSGNNNIFKYSNLDTIEEAQTKTVDVFIRDENVHEMQEHFVKKDFKAPQESIKNNDSSGLIEDDESAFTRHVNRKNEMTEPSCLETFNKKVTNLTSQHQNDASHEQSVEPLCESDNICNKTSKPRLISSVPVTVDIIKKQGLKTNIIERKTESTMEMNEEAQSLLQKQFLLRKSNATKGNNSVSLVDPHDGDDVNPLTHCKADSTTPRKVIKDKSTIPEDSQNKGDSKPKSLSGWIPRVTFKPELNLTFEGTLLNEAGHVVHRKFKTAIIRRRISQKLVQTVNDELYELIGDLSDTKHVVPKELVNVCRYGCPLRIEQFCKTWWKLSTSEELDSSMDAINVTVSSKGRRIIPPLSYWTGERIALKDNNLVYSPGNSLTTAVYESPNKNRHLNKTKKQETNKSKQNSSNETENVNGDLLGKSTSNKSTDDSKQFKSNRESATKNKRRIVQQAHSSGSDDTNSPVNKKQRVRENQQKSLNSIDVMNKRNGETTTRSKLRANDDVIVSRANTDKQMSTTYQFLDGRNHDLMCVYIPNAFQDRTLSDDAGSAV